MRGELEIPRQFAGGGVQGDHTIGKQVVARAHVPGETRTWVADAPVEEVGLRIIAPSVPGCASPRFPGVIPPCFVPGFAGTRDRIESPLLLAGRYVIGGEKPPNPELASRDSHHDRMIDDERRPGDRVAFGGACDPR